MADTATAKLFKHGRSQAVRLPKEFVCRARKRVCAASGAAYCWSRLGSRSIWLHGGQSWTSMALISCPRDDLGFLS